MRDIFYEERVLRHLKSNLPSTVDADIVQTAFDKAIKLARAEIVESECFPVLQAWTETITRRQQGVMVLALRGPDGMPKEHPSKNAVRSYRACVMNNGRTGYPMEPGVMYPDDSFMRMDLILYEGNWNAACVVPFFSALDQYNIHFLLHFLHGAAVLGFNHPSESVRERWLSFYHLGCDKMHMNPETEEQFKHRLRDGKRDKEDVGFIS